MKPLVTLLNIVMQIVSRLTVSTGIIALGAALTWGNLLMTGNEPKYSFTGYLVSLAVVACGKIANIPISSVVGSLQKQSFFGYSSSKVGIYFYGCHLPLSLY